VARGNPSKQVRDEGRERQETLHKGRQIRHAGFENEVIVTLVLMARDISITEEFRQIDVFQKVLDIAIVSLSTLSQTFKTLVKKEKAKPSASLGEDDERLCALRNNKKLILTKMQTFDRPVPHKSRYTLQNQVVSYARQT